MSHLQSLESPRIGSGANWGSLPQIIEKPRGVSEKPQNPVSVLGCQDTTKKLQKPTTSITKRLSRLDSMGVSVCLTKSGYITPKIMAIKYQEHSLPKMGSFFQDVQLPFGNQTWFADLLEYSPYSPFTKHISFKWPEPQKFPTWNG